MFSMSLLIMSTLLCWANAFIPLLLKPILSYASKKTSKENILTQEIMDLRREMDQISMTDDFAKHAKIQRKINKLQSDLKQEADLKSSTSLRTKLILTYGSKAILGIIMASVAIAYRYTPVVIFDENFDLSPFEWILRFPTGKKGAISLHVWFMICNYVSKSVVDKLC